LGLYHTRGRSVCSVRACRASVRHECVRERPDSSTRRRMLASSFAVLDHGTKVEPTSRGNVKVTFVQKPSCYTY